MADRLHSTRDALAWGFCFLAVAGLIVVTGFTSNDPDSALYAGLADRLAHEPFRRWIAPEWWGFWPEAHMTGYFREHPAGAFLLPAAMNRIGLPAVQGAYVVGVAAGLASLLMMASLIRTFASRDDARAALVLLQLMPVAFIFRIRANHEYPMLVCLLMTIAGLVWASRGRPMWGAMLTVCAGLTAGLLIKGVFVAKILLAAAVWIAVNPIRQPGAGRRCLAVSAAGVAVMLAAAYWYEAMYHAVTSEGFWRAYWERQVGSLPVGTPVDSLLIVLRNVLFYVSRLVWHPAPWSLALIALAWPRRGRLHERRNDASDGTRRGFLFAMVFSVLAILLLSPASRFAERYAFSATHIIACAGVVAANRAWPWLSTFMRRLDERVPVFPALVWLLLMCLRLTLGPLLPRV